MKFFNSLTKKNNKGQVLVIVALTLTMLVAVIGLAIDMGYMYVSYSRVRRAVDAAALAGSGEFKRNYTAARLQGAAEQMLALNGFTTANSTSVVDTCDTIAAAHGITDIKANLATLVDIEHNSYPGQEVCTDPLRKVVRVSVSVVEQTYFLSIIGIREYPINTIALTEAATVDVLMVIDTSDSMTYGWAYDPKTGVHKDPNWCNADDSHGGVDGIPGSCFPFQDVKQAAFLFLKNLYFPYDRVGVVTFNRQAKMELYLSDDAEEIEQTILNLTVFEAPECPYTRDTPPYNGARELGIPLDPGTGYVPCRLYNNPTEHFYLNMDCSSYYGLDPDATACMNTNVGDGVALGGSILTGVYPTDSMYDSLRPADGWPDKRDEALWVMLLLTDGAANTGSDVAHQPLCPALENNYAWGRDAGHQLCRDDDALARHCWSASDLSCVNANYAAHPDKYPPFTTSVVSQALYDGDDRAHDMFDIVSSNNTLIFTIGMGDAQRNAIPSVDVRGIAPGESLLQFGAYGTYTDKFNKTALKGLYYFGNNPADLTRIFLAIANNLATRINQ